jgi:hypothetical protein
MSKKIDILANLFSQYRIYPSECFNADSIVRQFQKTHPSDHFSVDIEQFLIHHQYKQERIGADLPWWGSNYFTDKSGPRVMIIAQDSNTKDAGSITFYANLMPIMSDTEYKSYTTKFQRFDGWKEAKQLIKSFGVDFDYLYITDARKVYPSESLSYKEAPQDSEDEKIQKVKKRKSLIRSRKSLEINKDLLLKEIECCRPDHIIVLGSSGLYLLDEAANLTFILENGNTHYMYGRNFMISPFPSNANPDYHRLKTPAIENIRQHLQKKN